MITLYAVTLAVIGYGMYRTMKQILAPKVEGSHPSILSIYYRENDPVDFAEFIKEPKFNVTKVLKEGILKEMKNMVMLHMNADALLRSLKLPDVTSGYLEISVTNEYGKIIRYVLKIPGSRFSYPLHLLDAPKEVDEATLIVNGESFDVSDLASQWETKVSGSASYKCMLRDILLSDPFIYRLFDESGLLHLNIKPTDGLYHICRQYTSISKTRSRSFESETPEEEEEKETMEVTEV